jgi:hypothetical protein
MSPTILPRRYAPAASAQSPYLTLSGCQLLSKGRPWCATSTASAAAASTATTTIHSSTHQRQRQALRRQRGTARPLFTRPAWPRRTQRSHDYQRAPSKLSVNAVALCSPCAHHAPPLHFPCRRLETASPVMTKSRAPAGGNNYPENGLVKPPRRDTRALSPAGMFGGKAPLRLAAQKSRPHAPSVPMRSVPAYFLCKWGV